mgnify:CR=1 FL=1
MRFIGVIIVAYLLGTNAQAALTPDWRYGPSPDSRWPGPARKGFKAVSGCSDGGVTIERGM